jgi:hypothetical protein
MFQMLEWYYNVAIKIVEIYDIKLKEMNLLLSNLDQHG